jgi:hypothetical protein
MNKETDKLKNGQVRVRLYLCDYNEEIWAIMPARINNGDSFFMDCFISQAEEISLKEETYDHLMKGEILTCTSSIWGQNEHGVHQMAYLEKQT